MMKNSQNETSPVVPKLDKTHCIVWGVAASIAAIFGAVTNVLTILLLKNRGLRSNNDRWILMLAITDLLLCVTGPPLEVIVILCFQFDIAIEPISSMFFMWFLSTMSLGSPFGQMIICLFRVCAVFAPRFYNEHMKSARLVYIVWIALCWVFPGLFCALAAFKVFGDFAIVPPSGAFAWNIAHIAWKRTMESTFTYTPAVVMLLGYISIFLRISCARDDNNREAMKRNARGSLMMFASCCFFIICFFPAAIIESESYALYATYPHALLWFFGLYFFGLETNPVS